MRLVPFLPSIHKFLFALLSIHQVKSLTLSERYLQFQLLDNEDANEALVDIYEATNGLSWTNNDLWIEDDCYCIWYGLLCEGNRLDKILLSKNDLAGTLPSASWLVIPAIVTLDLSENSISGPIPTEIFSIESLEILNLSGNSFSGTIPTEIGNLQNLKVLDISDNSLSGSIPTTIGLITTLESLEIHQNSDLTGGMPTEICTLYSNWVDNLGNLAAVVGDCTIGECDALGIGQNFPCPCTCCAIGETPCCYSDSSSNCTDF